MLGRNESELRNSRCARIYGANAPPARRPVWPIKEPFYRIGAIHRKRYTACDELFIPESSLIHSAAPPFQITTVSLRCDLVLVGICGIYSVAMFQINRMVRPFLASPCGLFFYPIEFWLPSDYLFASSIGCPFDPLEPVR